jgi:beta-galactosidase
VTAAVPSGFDYEKDRYLPGIFDSVELILSGTPNIVNVQVAPELSNRQARVQVRLKHTTDGEVTVQVREAKSRKVVGKSSARLTALPEQALDLTVPISDCHLWSPEDPFLYEIIVRTVGDEFATRFGMREFKFDPATGRAMLNGRPYFMRGSNITLYRFFEDPDRGDLPWREDWVRQLHRRMKDMHWNCLRYCIGFPPEAWYRIADEEGLLIQDEFPIWFGGKGWSTWPKELKADELAKEYAEWMRERWNHPSVVIWDADNETSSPELGLAIQQVRALDLSGRPWDNSYNLPQEPGDVFESHPYHFQNSNFKLADLARADPIPQGSALRNDGKHAVVINEYGWLWLNRDGTPTTLTEKLYQNLLGTNSTTAQRRHLYARYTAAETEFWRSHRTAAAVMHFTALGYSRPDGQTSDHWLDIRKLEWEPEFYRYVRDAFAPVGLMIDAWAEDYAPGKKQEFPVVVVNDLNEPWKGDVRFRILRNGKVVSGQELPAEVAGFGTARLVFTATIPEQPGNYQAEAILPKTPAGPVRSLRDFAVLTTEQRAARHNLAEGRPVKASSVLTLDGQTYPAEFAVDGKQDTRWSSEFSDPQWLAVDLGETQTVSRVELAWETAFAKAYAIQVSTDGENWKSVHTTDNGAGKTETLRFAPTPVRWVRLHGTQRGTSFGYSLWEVGIYH